jgi:hypothetical protein
MSVDHKEKTVDHERAAKAHNQTADHHEWAARHYRPGDAGKGTASALAASASAGEAAKLSEKASGQDMLASVKL